MARRTSPQRERADEIIEEINALFGDTSVPQEVTLELMEEIEEAASANAVALKDDIRRNG